MNPAFDLRESHTLVNRLVRTKLQPPLPENDWLVRTRLLTQLNQALTRPLILVSAPTGFGKTSLLAQWLAQAALPAAWVSLEDDDNDPYGFIACVTAAVRGIFPSSCGETMQMLQTPQSPPIDLISAALLNDLGELFASDLNGELILILDDFDRITDQTILDWMIRVVEFSPRNLHVVLSARVDPSLPLVKWRVRGQMLELCAADLRVTPEEAHAIVLRVAGEDLDHKVIEALHARTEGWVVGLRMAALSLEQQDDKGKFIRSFKQHAGSTLMDFLESEVLSSQAPPIQSFLVNTSIFARFSDTLCETVLRDQAGDAKTLLRQVVRANLFITPLDQDGDWYSYHVLFREMLERELHARYNAAHVSNLHRRASQWFAAHGMIDDAVRHALAADDLEHAAQLVEENIDPDLNREDWRTLEERLKLLPEELIWRRPRLLMVREWMLNEHQRQRAVVPIIARVQELMRDQDESTQRALHAEIAIWQSQNNYLSNESEEGLALAREALDALPMSAEYVRSLAVVYCSLHLYQLGRVDAARDFCIETIDREAVPTPVSMRAFLGLCHIYRQSNRLDDTQRAAERMLHVGRERHFYIAQTWAHYLLGSVAYVRNELDAARAHFLFVSEERYKANSLCLSDSLIGLGLVYAAQNREVEANETLQDLYECAAATGSPLYGLAATVLRVRLDLARGDAESAMHSFANQTVPLSPLWLLLPPSLVEARTMAYSADPTMLRSALDKLSALRKYAERTRSEWHLIEILALQAIVNDKLGENKKALEVVGQALALAQSGGVVRPLVELGVPLERLVRARAARTPANAFVRKLLDAFGTPRPIKSQQFASHELDEPLNPREIQVLHYLERRYTASEIAVALVISSWTVRTHTRNIYRKLKVNDRNTAVAQAQALGLLARA